jgi:hypothetical protein
MTNPSIVPLKRSVVLLAAASLLGACSGVGTGDGARATAAGARPASVPLEFVRTADGFVHPSCAITLGADERYEPGAIVGSDGTRRDIAPCAYERYDLEGKLLSASAKPKTSALFGAVAQASMNVSGVTYFSADWTVPGTPIDSNNSVPELFDGLLDDSTQLLRSEISVGHGLWLADVVFCCVDGNELYTDYVEVHPGDRITGFMNAGGNGTWYGHLNVNGSPAADLTIVPDLPFTQVVGAAFIAPPFGTCGFYPSSGGITFNNFGLIANGNWVAPTWQVTTPAQAPNCLTGVSANASAVSMTWNASDPPPKCTLVPHICCTKPDLPVCSE